MASLHPAAGSPAVFDRRVFNHNPFLTAEPVALQPANAAAALAESLEVTVLWGTNVLTVQQLTPPRAFAVGEVGGSHGAGTSAAGNVDFAMAAERLGTARREIVSLRQGAPLAVFMSDEAPKVYEKGKLVDARTETVDCSDVAPGARGIELRHDRVVVIEACGVAFRLAGTEKPVHVPRAILGNTDRSALGAMGVAAIMQGLLVGVLAYLTPSLAEASDDELNRDRLQLMQQYLQAQAERQKEQKVEDANATDGQPGAPAEAQRGPEGKAGRETATLAKRMGIQGDQPLRTPGRAEMLAEARDFGIIGMLSSMNASMAPSSPWGADIAQGPDAKNGMGDMWSDDIGDGPGHRGFRLSGTGLGGGGKGVGVGIGGVGTCMGLDCYGNGGGWGLSRMHGRPEHQTKVPRVRPGVGTVSGHLPPEVIQRIVRQNFGRFRACYAMGLTSNPNLEGRVTVRFVIGRDGAVSNVSSGGDLPNAQVTSCVGSAFYGLSFPPPEAGIVTVSYPIMLTPG